MNEYPLLTAWLEGHLYEVWQEECNKLKREDPKLLDSVAREYAGARVSAYLTQEYQCLWWTVEKLSRQNLHNPGFTSPLVEFYDALTDGSLQSYRSILRDISGNPNIWADETGYLESIKYLSPEIVEAQMEAYTV